LLPQLQLAATLHGSNNANMPSHVENTLFILIFLKFLINQHHLPSGGIWMLLVFVTYVYLPPPAG